MSDLPSSLPSDLREKSIQRMKARRGKLAAAPHGDVDALIQELEIHQVELEVQNEELRSAQLQLGAAVECFRDLFDCAPVGYLTADGNYKILQLNRAAAQLCGRDRDKLEGRRIEEIAYPEDRDTVYLFLRNSAGNPFPRASDFRVGLSSGSPRWVHADIARVHGDQSEGAKFRLTLTDITARVLAEQAVRETQVQLQVAIDAAQFGPWHWDIRTGEMDWSSQCKALYGLPADAPVTYEQFLRAVHPDDRVRVQGALNDAINDHAVYSIENRVVRPDGLVRWTASQGRCFYDEKGLPVSMAGITMDITGRKEYDEALRSSEARLRIATEAANMFAWECDVPANAIRWSENAAAVIGCRPEELPGDMGKRLFFAAPADQARLRKEYEEAIASRQIVYATEFRGLGKPEQAKRFQKHGRILYGEDGAPLRIFGVTQDITDRKRTEEQVRKAAADLRLANDELTKFNRAMVGRELRMVELKREVNELCAAMGKEHRYALEFDR